MKQFYYVKETSGYTVRSTTGGNAHIVSWHTTKTSALASIRKLNKAQLTMDLAYGKVR